MAEFATGDRPSEIDFDNAIAGVPYYMSMPLDRRSDKRDAFEKPTDRPTDPPTDFAVLQLRTYFLCAFFTKPTRRRSLFTSVATRENRRGRIEGKEKDLKILETKGSKGNRAPIVFSLSLSLVNFRRVSRTVSTPFPERCTRGFTRL